MLGWAAFTKASPDISAAGLKLLELNEVAFVATVSASGRPRLHPFVPKVVEGRLVAFIMATSPKFKDLQTRRQYSIHTLPGAEDEECFLSGEAKICHHDQQLRSAAIAAMGFATEVKDDEVLFEFCIDRALWTRWLDFGSANHRPHYLRWSAL